ncbi:hypothetical protein OE88DRAFT_1643138 [Heliocybe sulcata]|uniref:Uncharacterized protein n=1 Tax=Heliocybe sulcata TaxID=5364 RepID=A0A5C3N7T6_9AGAM|nr:hypothetical protein OE88DRAFT_1643138 [Heliocybe sulcata]
MTSFNEDVPMPTRKSRRKAVPNRRLGSPTTIAPVSASAAPATNMELEVAIAAARVKIPGKKKRIVVIEETDSEEGDPPAITVPSTSAPAVSTTEDTPVPNATSARKVGRVRKSSVKSKKGKGKASSKVAVDSNSDKSGSDEAPPIATREPPKEATVDQERWDIGSDFDLEVLSDADLPPPDQMFKKTTHTTAVEVVPNKMYILSMLNGTVYKLGDSMIRGTKRAVVTSDAEVSESGDIKPAINEVPVIKRSKTSAISGAEGKQESNVSKTDNTARDTKVKKTASMANVVDLVSDDDGDQNIQVRDDSSDTPVAVGVDSDQDDDVKIIDRHMTGTRVVLIPTTMILEVMTWIRLIIRERTDLTLHESLHDPDLEDTYNLPLLTRICILSSSGGYSRCLDEGQVRFSAWSQYIACHGIPPCLENDEDNAKPCQHIRHVQEYIKNAITFTWKVTPAGHFINLSRISPSVLSINNANNATLYARDFPGHPALCFSVVAVAECHLLKPLQYTNSDWEQKFISGVFHSVEWERFSTVVCQTFNSVARMKTRLDGNAIAFGTKSVRRNNQPSSSQQAPDTPSRKNRVSLFSPGKASGSASKSVPGQPGTLRVLDPSDEASRLHEAHRSHSYDGTAKVW